ncbi:MAG: dTMP kinase [Firmicutes bacterium HGW-Firmicutes-15]|nr:MAG: dTMP kinase [Firmicutes bacterium HGW-Firmicutes-15]
MQKRGTFISLEGIDGSGKTTLKENLLALMAGNYHVIGIREPGGTVISEKIRDMLLDVHNDGIIGKTEALLYAAARSQLVEEIIRPALIQGKIIIADRYMDSTIAYQGYGRGLDIEFLEDLNRLCTGGLKPDLTLLLDIDPEAGQSRRNQDIPDRLEKEGFEFQARIRAGYLKLCEKDPSRIKVLDASQTAEQLIREAMGMIEAALS